MLANGRLGGTFLQIGNNSGNPNKPKDTEIRRRIEKLDTNTNALSSDR